jgi:fermentation-respiration switch protein FrsA (DUF1100 family)
MAERPQIDNRRLDVSEVITPVKRWRTIVAGFGLALVLAASAIVLLKTRSEAHRLLTNPIGTRKLPTRTPIDFGMVYDEVTAHTSDGLALAGWYVPSENGAIVLAQHGYKSDRAEMLNEAAMLHRHGYGVLITSIRAHDMSDGNLITFGKEEMKDLDAWFEMARAEPGADPQKIGILGNSLGGSLAIEFAARCPDIKAVATNSAFSSLTDTIETSVRFFTGLPPFPFAPLITFWAEREAGFRTADVDAKKWISSIAPRSVLLMQGGADVVISSKSGQLLYDAARQPKELWFEPNVGHAKLDTAMPAEYERRVVGFFDKHLLGP